MRLGDLDALKEDFKARLEKAKNWKENALNNSDDELVIRATATIDFICEVIMTINYAPTVELNDKSLEIARKSIELGRNVGKLEGKLEKPQGEWIETEYQRNYEGGANLTFKGWQCSNCGFERHRKRGMSKFCENCGAKMKGGAE